MYKHSRKIYLKIPQNHWTLNYRLRSSIPTKSLCFSVSSAASLLGTHFVVCIIRWHLSDPCARALSPAYWYISLALQVNHGNDSLPSTTRCMNRACIVFSFVLGVLLNTYTLSLLRTYISIISGRQFSGAVAVLSASSGVLFIYFFRSLGASLASQHPNQLSSNKCKGECEKRLFIHYLFTR